MADILIDRPLPHHPPPIVSKGAAKGAYPPPISFENIPSHFSPRQSHPLKETEDGREKADQLQGGWNNGKSTAIFNSVSVHPLFCRHCESFGMKRKRTLGSINSFNKHLIYLLKRTWTEKLLLNTVSIAVVTQSNDFYNYIFN